MSEPIDSSAIDSSAIDTTAFFEALAAEMNAHPDRYRLYGEADMDPVLVMRRPDGDFRVRLHFAELACADVTEVDESEAPLSDFRLEGDLAAWQGMFDDIRTNGSATGLWTINSLALMGDKIVVAGDDPMGTDKFSRFNQTLQEFLDGAARLDRAATAS
jgi:hypothetical protein